MTTTRLSVAQARLLLTASLCVCITAAHAASGYTIRADQEALVKPGMRGDEVQQVLGTPDQDFQFRTDPGRTYSYRLSDRRLTAFDIHFGADGKVASVSERAEDSSSHGGHR